MDGVSTCPDLSDYLNMNNKIKRPMLLNCEEKQNAASSTTTSNPHDTAPNPPAIRWLRL